MRRAAKQNERFAINIENQKNGGIVTFSWDETEVFASFLILSLSK
ncbi:hypothetical protein J7I42_18890 [Niastella sp. MAH-29]|uniref:Uncharacterized protein n=1 Tax=Niastella soli TaxID=2821487 RepID=A0ABS3YY69_9BACT|nr:hypothetical protein [Niastella soli]